MKDKGKPELMLVAPIGSMILVFLFGFIIQGTDFIKDWWKFILSLFFYIELLSLIIYYSIVKHFKNIFYALKNNLFLVCIASIINIIIINISRPELELIDFNKFNLINLVIIAFMIFPFIGTKVFKKIPLPIRSTIEGLIGLVLIFSILILGIIDASLILESIYELTNLFNKFNLSF
ncbi:MAG: hypothetical protein PHI45_01160 [Candidatus Pacebacteria bacterium]|nr:hypothetical protein [Candidatus Paceibacterota bacterium]MDD5012953.1 hypothetical protein [Candidatus Paceibacterota bacterium]MDD5752680.1 hypothetical protein [Candidatus Paceibacterota bacterium]